MQFDNKIRMKIIIADRVMVIITVCHTFHNPLKVATSDYADLDNIPFVMLSVKIGDFESHYRYIESMKKIKIPLICNGINPKFDGFKDHSKNLKSQIICDT